MDISWVKKEKPIRDFKEEISFKGNHYVEKYDKPFFQILNAVYLTKPLNIIPLVKENCLVMHIQYLHKRVLIEWYNDKKTFLVISDLNDGYSKVVEILPLPDALKLFTELCMKT